MTVRWRAPIASLSVFAPGLTATPHPLDEVAEAPVAAAGPATSGPIPTRSGGSARSAAPPTTRAPRFSRWVAGRDMRSAPLPGNVSSYTQHRAPAQAPRDGDGALDRTRCHRHPTG